MVSTPQSLIDEIKEGWFDQVSDWLWTGRDLSLDLDIALQQLGELGENQVTTMIDTRSETQDEAFILEHYPRMKYLHVPRKDDGKVGDPAWWQRGLDAIEEGRRTGKGRVYVHCHMGINRGPSLACAALSEIDGMKPIDAWEHMRKKRPRAWASYYPDFLRLDDRDLWAANEIEMILVKNADRIDRKIAEVRKAWV